MGLLAKIFGRRDSEKEKTVEIEAFPPECRQLMELKAYINELEEASHYIARSEYQERITSYNKTMEYFSVLKDSGLLETYCNKNKFPCDLVLEVQEIYNDFQNFVEKINETYIKSEMKNNREYLDQILSEVDPGIFLDDDQRRVVLTDEDYCLVIAGAGAGKTTTVAAKVKYLIEKKEIEPSQILVISFTNKAVQELKDKINKDLGYDCPIATFHSTGNAILHINNPEKLNIVDGSKLYFVIQNYFRNSILKNEEMVNNLILFFASYFDAPYEGDNLNNFFNKLAKENYSTMKSDFDEFRQQILDSRSKKKVTIQNEVLRSAQEVEIANFLYLNNINYKYEPIYKYDILCARKPYTPDFLIWQGDNEAYIEHFGITEDGRNNRYSDDELESYKKAVNDKIRLHQKHGTALIYTFSEFKDQRSISAHLQEELNKHGFELKSRSNQEIMHKLVCSEENRYIRKLVDLICRFIQNFKTNGYTVDEFRRMSDATKNVRTKLFLSICTECYLEYERFLKANHAVDFEDMINESAKILNEVREMRQKLDFKYVIVDEYQDISRQRFDLVKALSEVTDAKIIAVGDDWQSIYAFSGSDITLFTKFEEKMGYAKLLKIVKTYRNSQEVIDIAGNFIQKNTMQIQKTLQSPKTITDPVIIYTYDSTYKRKDGNNRSGVNYTTAFVVQTALETIMEYNRAEGKEENASSILLLGRFGFDGDMLEKSGLFEFIRRGNKIKSVKYPRLNISFMTAHASKGLGYDNVIVINGRNETYGFPAKIEDDPVLSFVIRGDRAIDYAEERRLFYVAMTRTKNRVFFIAPEQNPSEFLLEIKRDYKNVVLKGNWNEEKPQILGKKTCPICGYPLQFRYKNAYGLRLYICTNEPEVCGFMTNEYKAGKLSIMKCDECRDGYLIVKPLKNNDFFLGCTNYQKDGKGCNKVIWKKQFYEMMQYEPDRAETAEAVEKGGTVKKGEAVEGKETVEKRVPEKVKVEESKPVLSNNKIFEGQPLFKLVETVLVCLLHISQERYYGATTLIDVLRGAQSQKLAKSSLNKVSEYGKLSNISREKLHTLIYWLIENHFILQTKGKYPVLHPTYNGMHYHEVMTPKMLKQLDKIMNGEENL